MEVRIFNALRDISQHKWDRICGEHDPFVEHGFLFALEESGSVGEKAGWTPFYVTVWDEENLVGAIPLYLKMHSCGEYIFDWAWAEASHRIGVAYYPKLVSMVPVTPATGNRFLVLKGVDEEAVMSRLLEGCFAVADETRASSIHLLFLNQEEKETIESTGRFLKRLTHQFHWKNREYGSFKNYLEEFRASARKQTRKERKQVCKQGIRIEVKVAEELTEQDWGWLNYFYRSTCAFHGSAAYLTSDFFEQYRHLISKRAVGIFAFEGDDKEPVAGSLNFEKGRHLYGRYWGCKKELPFLHFEVCYYQLIERAIERGFSKIEAGAQGMHKLKRGFEPTEIYSAHWIRDEMLSKGVAQFLKQERELTKAQIQMLQKRGPFKRN